MRFFCKKTTIVGDTMFEGGFYYDCADDLAQAVLDNGNGFVAREDNTHDEPEAPATEVKEDASSVANRIHQELSDAALAERAAYLAKNPLSGSEAAAQEKAKQRQAAIDERAAFLASQGVR